VLARQADLVELAVLARVTGAGIGRVVVAHASAGELLGLPRLRAWTAERPGDSHWVLAARGALRDELDQHRVALAGALLRTADGDVERFAARHAVALGRFADVRERAAAGQDDVVARGCVVATELRRLVQAVG
jgi:glutamate dehydrogenase